MKIVFVIFLSILLMHCISEPAKAPVEDEDDYSDLVIEIDTVRNELPLDAFKHPSETAPRLIGNLDSLSIGLNRVPADKKELKGKVLYLQLLVDEKGQTSDLKIIKPNIAKEYHDEIIGHLQGLRFNPRIVNGKPVKTRMVLPLYF
ncbi:MAG: hypothetical protein AAGJ93_07880 [Bacteroidota bacterium]